MKRLFALLCTLAVGSVAAAFEISVIPSRFELAAKRGARVGQSLELHNMGNQATEFVVRTIDWRYTEDGQISYHDELLPDSCRPWVTLERNRIALAAHQKRSYRFQVDIPPDAKRGECRFMLAVEGVEPAYHATVQRDGVRLSLPVTGRIAVAVYVAVDGARPRLTMESVGTLQRDGQTVPVVTVKNAGEAHGRLAGGLEGVDARERSFEWFPETTPVLPGQTRTLALTPRSEEDGSLPPPPVWPVRAKGMLDWEGGSFKVEATLR